MALAPRDIIFLALDKIPVWIVAKLLSEGKTREGARIVDSSRVGSKNSSSRLALQTLVSNVTAHNSLDKRQSNC